MEDKDWWGWIGIKKDEIYTWSIGPVFTFIFLLLFITLTGLLVFQTLAALTGYSCGASENTDCSSVARNYALIAAAIIGFPIIIWRTSVAQKQANIAEQAQITNRISRAVEGLGARNTVKEIEEIPRYKQKNNKWLYDNNGNLVPATRPDGKPLVDRKELEYTEPNLEERVGALQSLERIAQDSHRDHLQIMEIICTYVRGNAPCDHLEPTDEMEIRPQPRSDIQVAINILGRRNENQLRLEKKQRFRLDLRNTDLSGVNFNNGEFSAAMFHNCRIEAGSFRYCKLHGTQFYGSVLNYSDFLNAELTGTRFDFSVINKPEVPNGQMSDSISLGDICGASFVGADISEITYLGEPKTTNTTFGTKDTKLHRNLEFDRKQYEDTKRKIRLAIKNDNHERASELREELEANNFVYWVPFSAYDGANGHFHQQLLERLDLARWPYSN